MKNASTYIILLIAIAVVVAGCTSQTGGNNTTSYKSFDKEGISLQYPGN